MADQIISPKQFERFAMPAIKEINKTLLFWSVSEIRLYTD
jgi:hypothetical protein